MVDITADNLSFCYPGATSATLDGLSFEVASNSTLSLLGSSGAGKTTLLKVLSGLLTSAEGSLLFDGKEVLHQPAGERGVSQVFQFPVLYESISVLDNIAFPLRALGYGKQKRRGRAREIAQLLGIDDWLDERPAALALYQAQIAGFAKALVRPDTALVLLDEPLTAVEPAMKWRLRGLLKRAQEQLQVSMIYVTHDQTEALTIANAVSVLHNGVILQTGSAAELYHLPQHSEVARFIGSPSMNFVRASVRNGELAFAGLPSGTLTLQSAAPGSDLVIADGPVMVGFRPEWASVTLGQQAQVRGLQVVGADQGVPVGYLQLEYEGQRLQVRHVAANDWPAAGGGADMQIERCLLFRHERLIGVGAAR